MNLKKLFATLAGVSLVAQSVVPVSVLAATYSDELKEAYDWAYGQSITTMSNIDSANMYGAITRAELAKMMANYAKNILGKEPNTSASCVFSDTASVKGDLATAIVEACQLGIMGQGISSFRPYDTITRAEFGTALSRLLWGNANEGGTPYYANHLAALKAAGIMNQTANAESTKEIRGYVMLMLMRSEDSSEAEDICNDPFVQAACLMGSDKCPAACQEKEDNKTDDKEDVVVKAGDLDVTATSTTDRKAILGATSDLDTLNFKTSEDVEITKITLERYGYSKYTDVANIWLEDEDGNKIATAKKLNSKDQVTLSIDKDYRKVDGNFNATIVVSLYDEFDFVDANNDGKDDNNHDDHSAVTSDSIGFKVISVESTAKNVDLDDYKPYSYSLVSYDAVNVELTAKGTEKDYNYEEGEMYEVAKFKLRASTSALEVNGFTLTNDLEAGDKLDLEDFLDKVEVTVDGETIKNVKYTVDKKELTVSFPAVTIESKGNATFALNIALSDFDEYGQAVRFGIKNSSDVKITEAKTSARVTVTTPDWSETKNGETVYAWAKHAFVGSKIKLTNTKLGNVDAAAGSTDVVIAEGTIEVAEEIEIPSYIVTVNYKGNDTNATVIEEMHLVIGNEEYDATPSSATTTSATFKFEDIEISKSGKVQVKADIDADAKKGVVVTFVNSALNSTVFDGKAEYTNTDTKVSKKDVNGSVSFANQLTVQAAKGALENNDSKAVEFLKDKTSRNTVFNGTYTAKKGDVYLNTLEIKGSVALNTNNEVTFYITVGDTEVTADLNEKEVAFKDVLVKAGESVKVKVEAEIDAYGEAQDLKDIELSIRGEDVDGNEAGLASDTLVEMRIKASGSTSIETSSTKNTVLLRGINKSIASFKVLPENNNDGIDLDDIVITATVKKAGTWTPTTAESCTINGTVVADKNETACKALVVYDAGTAASCTANGTVVADKDETACKALADYENNTCTINGTVVADKDETACKSLVVYDAGTAASCTANGTVVADKDETACKALAVYTQESTAGTCSIADRTSKTACEEIDSTTLTANDIRVKVDGTEYDGSAVAGGISYLINESLGSNGSVVEVSLKKEYVGTVELTATVNGKTSSTFNNRFEDALVYVKSQEDHKGSTTFVFGVEKGDSDYTIKNFVMSFEGNTLSNVELDTVANNDDVQVSAKSDYDTLVKSISYDVYKGTTKVSEVSILRDKTKDAKGYVDFFKIGSENVRVFGK